jgi:hypothetical protein
MQPLPTNPSQKTERGEKSIMSNHNQYAPAANPWSANIPLRIIYAVALASIALPMPISAWAGLSIASVSSWIFLVPMLVLLLIAAWRIVGVIRDPRRLDAPAITGVLKWFRSLAIALLAVGAIVYVLRWFVVPIAQFFFKSPSGIGVEYFVVGVWLSMFSLLTPLALLMFEGIRLFALESWYRKMGPSASAWRDTQ